MKKATTAATPTLPYILAVVKPTAIGINPGTNPRIINEKHPDFLDLLNSIKAVGVQQPICVRRTEKGGKGGWELLAKRAAKTKTPAKKAKKGVRSN